MAGAKVVLPLASMYNKKVPWTAWEDEMLIRYVREYGEGNWNDVRKLCPGLMRQGKSCRLRYKNHLRPGLSRGSFTPAEQRIVLANQARHGNRWSKIAAMLPGRTDNDVKNYWNSRLKKLRRQIQLNKLRPSSSSSCATAVSPPAAPNPWISPPIAMAASDCSNSSIGNHASCNACLLSSVATSLQSTALSSLCSPAASIDASTSSVAALMVPPCLETVPADKFNLVRASPQHDDFQISSDVVLPFVENELATIIPSSLLDAVDNTDNNLKGGLCQQTQQYVACMYDWQVPATAVNDHVSELEEILAVGAAAARCSFGDIIQIPTEGRGTVMSSVMACKAGSGNLLASYQLAPGSMSGLPSVQKPATGSPPELPSVQKLLCIDAYYVPCGYGDGLESLIGGPASTFGAGDVMVGPAPSIPGNNGDATPSYVVSRDYICTDGHGLYSTASSNILDECISSDPAGADLSFLASVVMRASSLESLLMDSSVWNAMPSAYENEMLQGVDPSEHIAFVSHEPLLV